MLTPSAIQRSTRITYHVVGQEKSKIVSELVSGVPALNYPALTLQVSGTWMKTPPLELSDLENISII
jgi:6-phosphogluconolactonase/glucosamine-6-phosphate isomerase/deaminase